MKIIPIALQAHYDTGSTCMANGLIIMRADGEVFAFTSSSSPFDMDVEAWFPDESVVTFDARQGLSITTLVSTAGLNVDNLEITTLDDDTLFDRDDVLAGRWRDAEFWLFRYRWDVAVPTIEDDVEVLARGSFGEVTLGITTIKVELRGLAQRLQQPVGEASTKTCRNRLGDARCKVDLIGFTHSVAVTSVTSRAQFTASGATQASDTFGEGIVTWLTGNNAGVSQKVRTFAGGVFTLVLPMVLDVQVGDTFSAVAGCRKRLMEDCKTKFSNVPNFRGEPHRPMIDDLTKAP